MTVHVRVRVGEEQYALPVESVREIAELGDVTPVPGAPAEVLGVRNLRGAVIPVLDLATLLGLHSDAIPERVVIAERRSRVAGLAVDEVLDVGSLPPLTEETESDRVSGAALVDGSLVGVVDLSPILDREAS